MVKLIYGGQGSGKTARLVQEANNAAGMAKGIIVYIDKGNNRMHDLDHTVKLTSAKEFGITNLTQLLAFIKGMVAGNYDIQTIYIDNIEKITNITEVSQLQELFNALEELTALLRVRFVLTVNCVTDQLPDFLKKYE